MLGFLLLGTSMAMEICYNVFWRSQIIVTSYSLVGSPPHPQQHNLSFSSIVDCMAASVQQYCLYYDPPASWIHKKEAWVCNKHEYGGAFVERFCALRGTAHP